MFNIIYRRVTSLTWFPFEDYKHNTGGNFALVTGLVIAIILSGAGLAVDASKAYSAKTKLQDTTDAIALLAAKDTKKNKKQLNRAAKDYFTLKYGEETESRIEISKIIREGDSVTVEAQHNIDTYFGGLFGKKTLDVSSSSTAIYAVQSVDIALVLDTTYSMTGKKLEDLKTASHSLIDVVEDINKDDIRMSVVPFAQYVNVGLSRRGANWLDVAADNTEKRSGRCSMQRDVISQSNCRMENKTCENDGVAYDCSREVCDYEFGPEYEVCSKPSDKKNKWNGCVGSRKSPAHLDVAYNGNPIPGHLNIRCGTEVRPLTKNLKHVKKTIDNLSANGETYMPSGLMWGWRMLHPEPPFDEVAKNKKDVAKTNKVLILMTDGDNTKSKGGEYHSSTDEAEANETTETLCRTINNDGITVYTIAYDVSDNQTQSLLRKCATDKDKYFKAKNSKGLVDAFEEIGRSLSQLRFTA